MPQDSLQLHKQQHLREQSSCLLHFSFHVWRPAALSHHQFMVLNTSYTLGSPTVIKICPRLGSPSKDYFQWSEVDLNIGTFKSIPIGSDIQQSLRTSRLIVMSPLTLVYKYWCNFVLHRRLNYYSENSIFSRN